jgi:hypothetical protein
MDALSVGKVKPEWLFQPIIAAAASAILLLAIAELDYGYYTFLRIAITVYAGVLTYKHFRSNKQAIGGLAAVIAILFNPAFPIEMDKETWMYVDALAAGLVWVINISNLSEVRDAVRVGFYDFCRKYLFIIVCIFFLLLVFMVGFMHFQYTTTPVSRLPAAVELVEPNTVDVEPPVSVSDIDEDLVWTAIRGQIGQPIFWKADGTWIPLSNDLFIQSIQKYVGKTPFEASIVSKHTLPPDDNGHDRTLIVIKSMPINTGYSCYSCGVLIGAYILRSEPGVGVSVVAGNPYVMTAGGRGVYKPETAPKLVQVGKDSWVVELPNIAWNSGLVLSEIALLGVTHTIEPSQYKLLNMGHVRLFVDDKTNCGVGPGELTHCTSSEASHKYIEDGDRFKKIKVIRTITSGGKVRTEEETYRAKDPERPFYVLVRN